MAHDNAEVWKKALWKRRSNNLHKLPDNHTSSRFLEDLVLNANAVPRDVVTVMCDAQVVVHQLSLTGLFAATHAHLRSNLVSGRTILFISTLLLVAATTACFLLDPAYANAFTVRRALFALQQAFLVTAGCFFIAPVLSTLTRNISSDTVHAWSVALLVAHLYLHDYFFVVSATNKLTGGLSLGAAVLASALLASRLDSPHVDAFAQVVLSMEVFVLSPYVRRALKRGLSRIAHTGVTVALVLLCAAAIAPLSASLAGASVGVCAFVGVLCPLWLVRVQKFKTEIQGPWDEAQLLLEGCT